MSSELTLPRVGTNMEEATILKWRKQPGESFVAGECLYEIETDKVTFEVEAPFGGRLLDVLVPEKEIAQVGQPVCHVEQTGPAAASGGG